MVFFFTKLEGSSKWIQMETGLLQEFNLGWENIILEMCRLCDAGGHQEARMDHMSSPRACSENTTVIAQERVALCSKFNFNQIR